MTEFWIGLLIMGAPIVLIWALSKYYDYKDQQAVKARIKFYIRLEAARKEAQLTAVQPKPAEELQKEQSHHA